MSRSVKKVSRTVNAEGHQFDQTVGKPSEQESKLPSDMMNWLHSIFGKSVDWKQAFMLSMVPLFIIAFSLETLINRRRRAESTLNWKEVWANIALGTTYQIMEPLGVALVTGSIYAWVYSKRLFDIPVDGWTILPIILSVEFCYYWFHRASHRIRWFWAAHVVHHTGENMNFTTAARQSMLNVVAGSFIFFLPPVLLGVPPAAVALILAVNLSYQYFIHTELIRRLPGWIEYIFNTPSHHRAHHGRNDQYIDKNYGGMLIIFDRMFGTFEEERETVQYGITQQIKSYNILVLNLHEFVDMWRDVMSPGPVWQRLQHLWRPPEWVRRGHEPIHTWTVDRNEPTGSESTPTPSTSAT
ncbi:MULTISPECIES: sterol desaturase family protein [Burkholderiaceae]|jgi:sterol desaturase/sphingolipid hydroxylase (fatty acid hydroxylase superfamily)|nr:MULTISPECIES: sterol desaturase family protein [Cupriavidus]SOZ22234.1 Sterol desaturase [Cupriavidus taiwanensis]SOZ34470.1 Sterol desaturase [Cupriavidus taiwanensis]SOZ53007.1 Sterol desaturase [Cupriavidus taiwanensis]